MTTQTLTNLTFIDDNNVVVHFLNSLTIGELSVSRANGTIQDPQPGNPVKIAATYQEDFLNVTPVSIDDVNKVYVYNISLTDTYRYFEYTGPLPEYSVIGYTYDENRNAFIPPCPVDGYILDDTTLEWKPDPTRLYDKDGDGKLYRYNEETLAWYPEN